MNHVHALLARGREILEQLFPGLNDEMVADGAPLLDMADDLSWLTPGGWGVRFSSELRMLAFTRPLLDLHVRRRLAERHQVEVFDNTEVVRLLSNGKKSLVGALVRTIDKQTGEHREFAGPGLKSVTRLAASPFHVWRDILMTSGSLPEELKTYIQRLHEMLDALEQKDMKRLESVFERANKSVFDGPN